MSSQPRILLLALVMAAFSTCALGAFSIVDVAGDKIDELTYDFEGVDVTSAVYEAGPLYLYTYIIDNPVDSSKVISWFSVDVADGTEITSIGYDVDMTNPAIWHEVVSGDMIISVDASFFNAIDEGETSTLLYYFSPVAPSTLTAQVGGTGGAVMGDVIAPVPEPATLLIVSMGALMLRRKK